MLMFIEHPHPDNTDAQICLNVLFLISTANVCMQSYMV